MARRGQVKPGDQLPSGMYWRGDVIWVRVKSGNVDKRVSTYGTSIPEAEALLSRLKADRGQRKFDQAVGRKGPAMKVGELIEHFLPEWEGKASWADTARYAREWKEALGGVRGDELTAGDVKKALREMNEAREKNEERPLGNAALNRRRQFLHAIFRKAVRDTKKTGIEENPVAKVERKEEVSRVRYADPAKELDKLWAACNEDHRAVFQLALTTGLRRGHILGLKIADVDLEEQLLRIKPAAGKKKAPRFVPLNEDATKAVEHLVERAKKLGSPWLVPGRDPEKPMEKTALSRAFSRACARAGLEDLKLHDMRHSFASYLTQAGVDALTLQDAMGHSSMAMVRKYAHANVASRRAAMDKLPTVSK